MCCWRISDGGRGEKWVTVEQDGGVSEAREELTVDIMRREAVENEKSKRRGGNEGRSGGKGRNELLTG